MSLNQVLLYHFHRKFFLILFLTVCGFSFSSSNNDEFLPGSAESDRSGNSASESQYGSNFQVLRRVPSFGGRLSALAIQVRAGSVGT